jgi:hypothetical protein
MKEGYYMILDPNDEEDMSLLRERSFDILIDATTEGVNEKEWNKYVAYGTYLVNENSNSQMQNQHIQYSCDIAHSVRKCKFLARPVSIVIMFRIRNFCCSSASM